MLKFNYTKIGKSLVVYLVKTFKNFSFIVTMEFIGLKKKRYTFQKILKINRTIIFKFISLP